MVFSSYKSFCAQSRNKIAGGIYFYLICILLVSFLSGCATSRVKPPISTEALLNLKDLCVQYKADFKFNAQAKVVTVIYQKKIIEGVIGSNEVVVGTERVKLSHAIERKRKIIFVPSDFIDLLEEKKPPVAVISTDYRMRKVKEIVIDAGHGGKDPGALGKKGSREKEVVLDISQRVKKMLEKEGINIVMIRDKDEFISLKDRTEITSKRKTDLFISIHANSNPKRAVAGLEVYILKDLTLAEKREDQRLGNERALFRALSVRRGDKNVEEMLSKLLYENKQAESLKLANLIVSKVSRATGAKNRGVKSARFFVLRNTVIPAVLIETGFVSNPKEERLLSSGYYRQKIANGIVEAIMSYINN